MRSTITTPDPIAPLRAFLTERTGVSFEGPRSRELETRLVRALEASEATDPGAFVAVLERDHTRLDALVQDLIVGETHFFREPGHLELLTGRILPELLAGRPADHRLRLWSAGCATGEEPYTLAILLEEAGLADHAEVIGTDISPAAIRRAREATYRSWAVRGVDEQRLRAYFHAVGDQFRLTERIADRVDFRPLNLVSDPYPSNDGAGLDVILCRNVLIYLTPPAITRVVGRLVGALAEGGWLVTASSDPHLGGVDGLRRVVTREGVAYRRGDDSGTVPVAARRRQPRRPDGRHAGARRLAAATRHRERTPPVASAPPDPVPTQPAAGPGRSDTSSTGPRPELTTVAHIRSLADAGELDAALTVADALTERTPTDPHVHHLRVVLLFATERFGEAADAAGAALYLDPRLAVTEIVRGRARLEVGDLADAARSFRNARRLLADLPAEAPVRFADGASAARLVAELDRLDRDGMTA